METLRHYSLDHLLGIAPVLPFLLTRRRYYRTLKPVPPSAEAAPHVCALVRDGITIIPGLFPVEVVAEMRAAAPAADRFTLSPEGDRALIYHDAHLIKAFDAFYKNSLIESIARAYICDDAMPLRRTVGLKTAIGDFPTFETHYHMDTWKQRLKVFHYLEDVSPDNAPLVYLKGSHRGFWRRATEQRIYRYYRTGPDGFAAGGPDYYFLGSFWPHEIRQLRNDYGFEELTCTGAAGTTVIFDGRGLHHATPLRHGRRLILTSYWIRPGHHI